MKKIIAILMALMCIVSCTLTANAASFLEDSEGSVDIQYHSYSNYTITLPSTSDGLYLYVELRDAIIEDGYRLEISATNLDENGYIPIVSTKNSEVIEHLSIIGREYGGEQWCVTADNPMLWCFSAGDYGDYVSMNLTLNGVDDKKIKPGDYTGVLCYRVSCRYVGNQN